jgi:hypothetical protein
MKLKLNTTRQSYGIIESAKVNKLRALGMTFEDAGCWCVDKPGVIEINSIEELVKLCEEWGEIIFDGKTIEIYNGDRE